MTQVAARCFMRFEAVCVTNPMVQTCALDGPCLSFGKPSQLPEEGGFPGSVGAAEQDQLAGMGGDRHVSKQHAFAAHGAKAIGMKKRAVTHRRSYPSRHPVG